MKRFITLISLAVLLVASTAFARDVYVRGHTKRDGTYVAPHHRTAPNHTRNDNWSTQGNVNPYTGQHGTKSPDPYGGYSNQYNKRPSPGYGYGY